MQLEGWKTAPKGDTHEFAKKRGGKARKVRNAAITRLASAECVEQLRKGRYTDYSGFLKDEALPVPDEPDGIVKQARAIHCFKPEINALVDLYIGPIEDAVYRHFPVAKHCDDQRVAELVAHGFLPGYVAYGTDISGFDRSVNPTLRQTVLRAIQHVTGLPPDIQRPGTCRMRYFEFRDEGSVHSGERGTSFYAVLIIVGIQHWYARRSGVRFSYTNCGDDNLVYTDDPRVAEGVCESMRRFGLDVRVEGQYQTPDTTLFLSRYWYNGRAQPDFWRAWGKLACLKLTPDDPRFGPWFRSKCDAYYSQYAHTPILAAVLRAVQSGTCTLDPTDPEADEAWGRLRDGAVFVQREYGRDYVTEADRQWFAYMYGITPEQQLELESHLASVIQYPSRYCGCLDISSAAFPNHDKAIQVLQSIRAVPWRAAKTGREGHLPV